MKEQSKEELRQSLDDLLGYDLPDEVPGLNEPTPVRRLPAQSNEAAVTVAKNKATRVLDSLLKLYLSEEIIEQEEYIKAKSELDKSALSMLIRQMENSETAITALMGAIGEGEVTPRMFEVLSDLQRTMLEIIKSQTMYMMAVEENAKKMSRDIDIYRGGSEADQQSSSNGGARSRGTKDLMRALQGTINSEVTDIDGEEDENEDVHDWDTDEE
jgi:hypothetical protein